MTILKGSSEVKVPGGKLIRVQCIVDEAGKMLSSIIITGDFFLHPEEGIQKLEKDLIGLRAEPEILKSHIHSFFKKGYVLVGATPEDFATAVLKATSREDQTRRLGR